MDQNQSTEAAASSETEVADPPKPSFTERLATYYITERGFRPGCPQLAAQLAEACDIILTLHTPLELTMVCIVDGERNNGKVFGLSLDATRSVMENCFSLTGKTYRVQNPVQLHIVEVAPQQGIASRSARLADFKREGLTDKRLISATVVEPAKLEIWSNSKVEEKFVTNVLNWPDQTAEDIQRAITVAETPPAPPLLTYGLLAVLAAIFALEISFGIGPTTGLLSPSLKTLVAFGGTLGSLVRDQHEWYRLFSATMLHADIGHILLNGIALLMGGILLERSIGRLHLWNTFVAGAVGGAALSVMMNPANIVGVGASGAITGLFAAALAISYHYPPGPLRAAIQSSAIRMLIPAILPIIASRSGGHIDYAAHLGGGLAGGAYGLILVAIWPREQPVPGLRIPAAIFAAIGLAGYLFALASVLQSFPIFTLSTRLVPQNQWESLVNDSLAGGGKMLEAYPGDPRSHLFRGFYLASADQYADAETELRVGLAQRKVMDQIFDPELVRSAVATLAMVQASQGRMTEAKDNAREVCGTSGKAAEAVAAANLCP